MRLNKRITDLLQRVGMTPREVEFYLFVSKNPNTALRDIQRECGFSMATTYRVFESLRDKKLLTSSPENWRKSISVISLRALADKLGRESLKLRKVEYELKKMHQLDQLSQLQLTENPIEILTDQNQLTEHCYRLLNEQWSHIYGYGSGEMAYEIPGEKAMHDFVTMRARKGKTIDVIFTHLGDHTKQLLINNKNELRNGKLYLDEHAQNSMMYMHDAGVTIWQKDSELGNRALIITDPGLIRMYQGQFKNMWARV